MAYVNTPAFYTAYQSRSANEQPLAIDGDLGDVLAVEIPHAGGVKQFVVRRNQLGLQGLGRFGFKSIAKAVQKVAAPVVKVAEKAAMVTTMGLPLLAEKALPKVASIVGGKPKASADSGGSIQYTDANGNPITQAQYNALMAQYNASTPATAATAAAVPGAPTSSIASTGATATPLGPTLSPTSNASSLSQPAGYGMDPSYGGAPIQSDAIASGYGGGQSYSDMVTSSDAYDASQEDYGTPTSGDEGADIASAGGAADLTADQDDQFPMSGLAGGHGGGGHGGGHRGGGFGRRGGFYLPYYSDDYDDGYPTVVILDERDEDDDEIDSNVGGIGALDTGASLVAFGAVAFAIYLMVRAQPKRRRLRTAR
jgi:hypothetical protein